MVVVDSDVLFGSDVVVVGCVVVVVVSVVVLVCSVVTAVGSVVVVVCSAVEVVSSEITRKDHGQYPIKYFLYYGCIWGFFSYIIFVYQFILS